MVFEKIFEIRWADLDPNNHVRHSAYNDYAAQARLAWLSANGFTLQKFQSLKINPVLFKETTEFHREVRADDKIRVTCTIGGVSEDGRKFRIGHEIFRGDGVKAATITVDGAWFSIETRKVIAAPAELHNVMTSMPKSEKFEVLP